MVPEDYRCAIVSEFGPPSGLKIERRATVAPAIDEVLVEVHAASVTPLDTYLRNGIKVGDYTPTVPYVPGGSMSGRIVAFGPQVQGAKVGDRVYGRAFSGSNAEYALCRASQIFKLPEIVAYADGAVISVPYETAYHSLVDLAAGTGGDVVLVQGAAGAVGAASVQMARMLGMKVIATCSERHIDAVLKNGAHAAFDYRNPDCGTQILEACGGSGVDIVIEVSARNNLPLDLSLAARGGRIIIVGGTGETPFNAHPMIAKGLKVIGVDLRSLSPRKMAQINAMIVAGLEAGNLRPKAANHFPLDNIAAAHAKVETGSASGGVVLVIKP